MMMGAMNVEFVATFEGEPDSPNVTGKIDVPIQGLKDAELTDIILAKGQIAFSFRPTGAPFAARFDATLSAAGMKADGTLTQAGQTFPFSMQRITEQEASDVGPRRPQTPRPPFPYDVEELAYHNKNDGTKLGGTLTTPKGDGPFPAVVLLTGSGAQDRDETLLGHKPFWVLADALTRRGLAVLRSDDRGVGDSTGSVMTSTTRDFAGDAIAAVELLRRNPKIDKDRIGLIGHSEGAIVAMIAASEDSGISFIVSLAGPAIRGDKLLGMQLSRILQVSGVDDTQIKQQLEAQQALLIAILNDGDVETIRARTKDLLLLQSGGAPVPDQNVDMQVRHMTSPWFRAFIELDPAESLRKVRCPVLAINGMLDTQVPYEENLGAIRTVLTDAGHKTVTVKAMKGLNHLLQPATTGALTEYMMIEQTIAPEIWEMIADWIHDTVGKKHRDD
jgi:pimeloyl-ACP methyl ester carboxylesterase